MTTMEKENKVDAKPSKYEVDQDGLIRISLVNQGVQVRRRRKCPLDGVSEKEIDYKNLKLLNKYVSERGKILPSRITSVCAKKQRVLSKAIKRARNLALLSFIEKVND